MRWPLLAGLVTTLSACALGPEPTAPRDVGPSHASYVREPAQDALLAAAGRDLACPTEYLVVRQVAVGSVTHRAGRGWSTDDNGLPVAEGCGRRALYAIECEPWPATECNALLLSLVTVPPPAERRVEP